MFKYLYIIFLSVLTSLINNVKILIRGVEYELDYGFQRIVEKA